MKSVSIVAAEQGKNFSDQEGLGFSAGRGNRTPKVPSTGGF